MNRSSKHIHNFHPSQSTVYSSQIIYTEVDQKLCQKEYFLISGLIDSLHEIAVQITSITGDRRRMTHPSNYRDAIPAEMYSEEDAKALRSLTEKIIDLVSDFYVRQSTT